MTARKYKIAGRQFTKVKVPDGPCHAVEDGKWWTGKKSWEHEALCGASIAGVPVSLQRLSCKACRKAIEDLKPKGEASGRTTHS